jgi:mannose/cellobiose epimerase-like protein (N-acyl-D-glucosamine 2-epimerase family)
VARGHGYLLPEHYSSDWEPMLDYNRERPDDPFRPFGCTPGHLLEWSRLLLQLEATLPDAPAWLAEDARQLFDTAVRVGWGVDGAPGFVYTVDWEGAPVVRTRMHWVVAEAIGAAAAMHRRTGEQELLRWSDTWWAYAHEYLVDRAHGSWHHELDPANLPSATVWQGKPDVYHAFQATLLPQLPLAPSAPVALK